MAKQTYTALNKKTGERERRETRKWYAFYTDPRTKRERRVPGYTDRRATEQLLARLEREAAQIAEGVLPQEVEQLRRPLAELLPEYLAHLRAKGDGEGHVELVRVRTEAVLDGAKLRRWIDLDAGPIAQLLAGWRKDPTKGKRPGDGMSAQTSNHYVAAVRGFSHWLARKLKLADPLAGLGKVGVEADRRHVRRTLSPDDFARLLAAAESGPVRCGLSGPDRAVLYLVAAYTGLRASALAGLAPELLQLTGEPPTLVLSAATNKSRKEKVFPLHPAVAARLRAWLADRPPGQKLWPSRWAADCRGAEMLRADLERAVPPIPYRDQTGRAFDFHALRGQFITNLARAGVGLVAAQKLAGHSTPTLTANYYTFLDTADLAKEVAKLPPPDARPRPDPGAPPPPTG